jgi:hypothetical protein
VLDTAADICFLAFKEKQTKPRALVLIKLRRKGREAILDLTLSFINIPRSSGPEFLYRVV